MVSFGKVLLYLVVVIADDFVVSVVVVVVIAFEAVDSVAVVVIVAVGLVGSVIGHHWQIIQICCIYCTLLRGYRHPQITGYTMI